MTNGEGICLCDQWTNEMKVGGEEGWVIREYNASTGYHWECVPDNSGVYEKVDDINLHPSVEHATGVPGKHIWKFRALRPGKGEIMFKNIPPGQENAEEEHIVKLEVK